MLYFSVYLEYTFDSTISNCLGRWHWDGQVVVQDLKERVPRDLVLNFLCYIRSDRESKILTPLTSGLFPEWIPELNKGSESESSTI